MQARDLLTKASADGTLEKVLAAVGDEAQVDLRKQARKVFEEAVTSGRLAAVLAETQQTPEVQRAQVAEQLAQAVADGKLQSSLGAAIAQLDDTAALRNATRDLLSQASADGRLEGLLADVAEPSVADLRSQARGVLAKATSDGRLEQVLGEVKREPDSEITELRGHLRELLADASADGRLSGALAASAEAKPAAPEDIDALREQARAKILEFGARGGFEADAAARAAPPPLPQKPALADGAAPMRAKATPPAAPPPAVGEAEQEVAAIRAQAAQAQQDVVVLRQTFQDARQDITELQNQAITAKNDVTEIRDWAREAKKDMDDLRRFANEAKVQMQDLRQAALDASSASK